jgi:hypothetical protein
MTSTLARVPSIAGPGPPVVVVAIAPLWSMGSRSRGRGVEITLSGPGSGKTSFGHSAKTRQELGAHSGDCRGSHRQRPILQFSLRLASRASPVLHLGEIYGLVKAGGGWEYSIREEP